ncbi:MAG: hypothetical protein SGI71_04495 [Verrucomicrobiota bacterium]|nr:hypothetical protein [Verrucomicrobiota bacterium]
MSEDIVFDCPVCGKSLVIDEAGSGMRIACPQCQGKIIVPKADNSTGPSISDAPSFVQPSTVHQDPTHQPAATAPPPSATQKPAQAPEVKFDENKYEGWDQTKLDARHKELLHLMKENASQRTETTEYISHANLKLQRETLKLRKLEMRKLEFDSELIVLRKRLNVEQ